MTWTMTVTSQSLQLTKGMTVTQSSSSGVATVHTPVSGLTTTIVLRSALAQTFDDTGDVIFDEAATNVVVAGITVSSTSSSTTPQPTIAFSAAVAGAAVTQGTSSGTLALDLSGAVSTLTINCKTGVTFDTSNDISIEDAGAASQVTINVQDMGTMEHTGATTKIHVRMSEDQQPLTTTADVSLVPAEDDAVPLTVVHAKLTNQPTRAFHNNCKKCNKESPGYDQCERMRRYNCQDWKQVLLTPGNEWSDIKSGLRIHTVTRNSVDGTMSFKVDWNAPSQCIRKAPYLKKWMRGHFYEIYLAKGNKMKENDIFEEDGVVAHEVAAFGDGEDLYSIVPSQYFGGGGQVKVVTKYSTYTRFYHDERYSRIFSIGIQENKNMDEMTCPPSQLSYRLLGIFNMNNEPQCGWQFEEEGIDRAACGQGLGAAVLNIGVPKGTLPGAYRVFVRGIHRNGHQKVKPYDAWHSVGTDNTDKIHVDKGFRYERQSYDEVVENSWEYILCVDEYNFWMQEIGDAGCGDPLGVRSAVTPQIWTENGAGHEDWTVSLVGTTENIRHLLKDATKGMLVKQNGIVVGSLQTAVDDAKTNAVTIKLTIRTAVGITLDTTVDLMIEDNVGISGISVNIPSSLITTATSHVTPNHLLKVQEKPCTSLDNTLNRVVPPSYPPVPGEERKVNWGSDKRQRASMTHVSVALVTRFQGPAGGYLAPPKQRCNLYAANTGDLTVSGAPAAPTMQQVLSNSMTECGGCVVNPMAMSTPFVNIAHHGDTPVNTFDTDYPGILRSVFPKVLTPETSYVAYCAQEGHLGMGRTTFTTLPQPTATPIVISNVNEFSFDLTTTFNTNNPVICAIVPKNKPVDTSILDNCQNSNMNGAGYAMAGVPFTVSLSYADQSKYSFIQPGGKYNVFCAQGSTCQPDEAVDDVVAFDAVEFQLPEPPSCVRKPATVDPNMGEFYLTRWRGDPAIFGSENTMSGNDQKLITTFPETSFKRVDVYRNDFVDHDSFSCQNSRQNYKFEVLGIVSNAPPADVMREIPSPVSSDAEQGGMGQNASQGGADDENMNYDDDTGLRRRRTRRTRRTRRSRRLTTTSGWKVEPSFDGRGSVAVGVPNDAVPGLYRIWLRTIHDLGNRCVDYVAENQVELYVCVCSPDDTECGSENSRGGINYRQVVGNPASTTAKQIFDSITGTWSLPESEAGKMKYLPNSYTDYHQFKCRASDGTFVIPEPQVYDIPASELAPIQCPACETNCEWSDECCATCAKYDLSLVNAGSPQFGVCGSCRPGSILDPITHACGIAPVPEATPNNEVNEWMQEQEQEAAQQEQQHNGGGGDGGGGGGGGGAEGHLGRHRLKIAGKNRGRNPPCSGCVCVL